MLRVTAVALVWLASSASADPLVTAPAGWSGGPNAELAAQASAQPHFGGGSATVTAERYNAPAPSAVVLMVVRATSATTDARTAAAAELAALRSHGPSVEIDARDEHLIDDAHAIEASTSWHDASTKTKDSSRTLVVATKDHITSTTAECLSATDADAALVLACTAALPSLRPGVTVDARVTLSPGATTEPAAPEAAPATSSTISPVPPPRPSIPPIAIAQDDPPWDKRPLIVGAGLVVLAAVFWWNRKRRARFAAESGAAKPDHAKRGDRDER
jgi:hypothetical protein